MQIPDSWWNERRKRDYYIDADGELQVRPDSPTGRKMAEWLMEAAHILADKIGTPEALERARTFRPFR